MSKNNLPTPEPRSFRAEEEDQPCLRLTPGEWRVILDTDSFLDCADNRFQHPRRFLGAPVQIIPDESFR